MTTRYKLGKKPARPGAAKLRLSTYLPKDTIKGIPPVFGYQKDVAVWGMLGNDTVGDCAEADAWHQTMLLNSEQIPPRLIDVTDQTAIQTYSAVTGFDPSQTDAAGNNPTDQGTDVLQLAEYRRTVGLTDAAGTVHRVGAYLALDQGNVSQLRAAIYLFGGAVSIGVQLPDSAQTQFQNGDAWSPVAGAQIEGGHCITGVAGDNDGNIGVITWGAFQWMTSAFYRRYNDESIVYLSTEFLTASVSPEGFDLAQLTANMAELPALADLGA